jgi:hypothetical protein
MCFSSNQTGLEPESEKGGEDRMLHSEEIILSFAIIEEEQSRWGLNYCNKIKPDSTLSPQD